MNESKTWKVMIKHFFLTSFLTLIFSFSNAQKINLEHDGSIEQTGRLSIEPVGNLVLAPESFQLYSSAEMVSFAPGVRIRPKETGFFRASIRDLESEVNARVVEIENEVLTIFPNPTENKSITIRWNQSPGEGWSFTLFTLGGKIVQGFESVDSDEQSKILSLDGLHKGPYLIRVSRKGRILSRKILIN